MNTVLKQMIDEYQPKNINEEKNAIKEILQQLILCGFSKTGFFNDAIFCGGTSLRIFYNLKRFSEDLDFSLVTPNKNYSLDKYINGALNLLKEYGINAEAKVKENKKDKAIQSAFLKANTIEQLVYFDTEFDVGIVHKNEQLKIKIEIDTNPPLGGDSEIKIAFLPEIHEVRIYDISCLFAGKLHSIIARFDGGGIKGRDLYDFVFYVSKKAKPNLYFLENAMKQSGHIKEEDHLSMPLLKNMLINKFEQIDYQTAIDDVKNFVYNQDELRMWNKEFFIKLVDMME